MSVDQTDKIDFVTISHDTGDVYLTISDHLEWNVNEGEHLLLLQEKINTYLAFIESGEMVERIPATKDRKVIISISGKYPLSNEAERFFGLVKDLVQKAGFDLEFELFQFN